MKFYSLQLLVAAAEPEERPAWWRGRRRIGAALVAAIDPLPVGREAGERLAAEAAARAGKTAQEDW